MRHRALRTALIMGVASLFSACASLPPARTLTEAERATLATLNVGDPAPPIAIGEWVRNTSVSVGAERPHTGSDEHIIAGFVPGKVYVLEFWASWCGPCLASMPRTSRLQARHGGMSADADLIIIGISALSEDNGRGAIRSAVRRYDPQYRIAIDAGGAEEGEKAGGITTERYAVAARETAVPRVFVIDRQGRIAWIGHPAEMEPVVEAVLSETWDLEKAAAEARRSNQHRTESRAIAREYLAALDANDPEAQLRAAERVIPIPVAAVDGLCPAYWGWTSRVQLLANRAARATDFTSSPAERQALIDAATAAAAEAAPPPGHPQVPGVSDDPMVLGSLSESLRPIDLDAATLYADRAMALVESLEAKPPTDEWEAFLAQGDARRHAYVRIQSALTYAAAATTPPANPDYATKAAKLLKQAIAVWPEDRRMLPNKAQLRDWLEGIEEKAKTQAR